MPWLAWFPWDPSLPSKHWLEPLGFYDPHTFVSGSFCPKEVRHLPNFLAARKKHFLSRRIDSSPTQFNQAFIVNGWHLPGTGQAVMSDFKGEWRGLPPIDQELIGCWRRGWDLGLFFSHPWVVPAYVLPYIYLYSHHYGCVLSSCRLDARWGQTARAACPWPSWSTIQRRSSTRRRYRPWCRHLKAICHT